MEALVERTGSAAPSTGRRAWSGEGEDAPDRAADQPSPDGGPWLSRAVNFVLALLAVIVLLPVFLLIGLVVKLTSRGPIFYTQERVGLDRRALGRADLNHRRRSDLGGQPFTIYKFRTMRVDAERDGVARWAAQADSRITPVGGFLRRTRIDEIPQIYNVLRGEMSFIGPRPERPTIVEQLRREIPFYDYRHAVKPGITGWAQINYSYGASLEDARQKLKLDLYYIKNYSVILDLLILMQTVRVVLWAQGSR